MGRQDARVVELGTEDEQGFGGAIWGKLEAKLFFIMTHLLVLELAIRYRIWQLAKNCIGLLGFKE